MKEKEIVKYHNDLNKIRLPNFTELEQNLLFSLIVKIKEQNGKSFYFGNSEIRDMIEDKYRYNNNEIVKLCKSLKEKFFKADFTVIEKEILNINNTQKEVLAEKTINLFTEFAIYYDKDVGNFHPEPMVVNFIGIALEINPKFGYLINKITKNFTSFELVEFIALSGKYTKTLYRLLKQCRSTGIARFEWSEFLRIMDIPEKLKMCDIDKDILKPAIKGLTKERNLFDQQRILFQNLTYEKIKGKGRGRGGNVIGIVFKFKPQKSNEFYLTKDEAIKHLRKENNELTKEAFESNLENSILKENNQALEYENEKLKAEALGVGLNAYCGLKYFSKDNEILCVINIEEIKNPSDKNRYKATIKNESKNKMFSIYIESIKHLLNIIKNNEYNLKTYNEALLERKNQKID